MISRDVFLEYDLPPQLIAERPVGQGVDRAKARLLWAKQSRGGLAIHDSEFFKLEEMLGSGDVLVLNNSRVLPVRFFIERAEGREPIEVLLIKKLTFSGKREEWIALARPLKKLKEGQVYSVLENKLILRIGARHQDRRHIEVELETMVESPIEALLQEHAFMPIPPYIRRGRADSRDREDYQTVFAEVPGSVAAPTAGLHFSQELLEVLRAKGVGIEYVTLHVGEASFRALGDNPEAQVLEEEFSVERGTFLKLETARQNGQRIIAVGTTVARTLESLGILVKSCGLFEEKDQSSQFNLPKLSETKNNPVRLTNIDHSVISGSTCLCISPRFDFHYVNALITNFHQPSTSHLLLVSAFFGGAAVEQIYRHALSRSYRFLSYGDGMFLEHSD